MPILQSRMISTIEAGRDYQQALDKAIAKAQELASLVKQKTISPDDGFWRLFGLLDVFTLMDFPQQSYAVLKVEHEYFKRAARTNALRRIRRQDDREAEGIAPQRNQTEGLTQNDEYLQARTEGRKRAVSKRERDHLQAWKDAVAAGPQADFDAPTIKTAHPGPKITPETQAELDAIKAHDEAEDEAMSHLFTRKA